MYEVDQRLLSVSIQDLIMHLTGRVAGIAVRQVVDGSITPLEAWNQEFEALNQLTEKACEVTFEAYTLTADLYAGLAQL